MFKNGYIKVSAATPKISVGNIKNNKKEIVSILDKTISSIIVFPELGLTGYTASDLFYQESFILEAKQALKDIIEQTTYQGVFIVGVPLDLYGILYNCAVVVNKKKIIGVVPKHYLPNSQEFYEKRWFHTGFRTAMKEIRIFDDLVPFGYLIFEDSNNKIRFGVEICQDLWSVYTPSDDMSLAGANLFFNLSASTERVGKPLIRKNLVLDHSRKQMSAYVYTSTGHFESSSEVVYSSHKIIANQGDLVKMKSSFERESTVITADIDISAINYQKRQDSTYRDMHMLIREKYQYIETDFATNENYVFEEPLNQNPFIPDENNIEDIKLANNLQVYGLVKKIESIPLKHSKIVIGISGGLDSALALLVAHQAMLKLNRSLKDIIAVTMPASVTSNKSKTLALSLMEELGVATHEIPIAQMVKDHLKSISHQEKDVTYENAQARIRTLILMDLANKHGGFVLGTGDLSEIALGWMTYNGDQMNMYAINAGLPKTWVQLLIKHHANNEFKNIKKILTKILKAPITPELKKGQDTQRLIGRYDVNDFILYHHLERGADEDKIKWLIGKAFQLNEQEASFYVKRFFKRFYTQQFKRQTLPEGPKILGVSLSPRGQYRMPSDVKREC